MQDASDRLGVTRLTGKGTKKSKIIDTLSNKEEVFHLKN